MYQYLFSHVFKQAEHFIPLAGSHRNFYTVGQYNITSILAIKPLKKYNHLSEEESFYAANNNQIIEDDKNEDQIWSKYL